MASKSTDKTIWTLALVAIVGFFAWKLWPYLKNKLTGGGSSGGAIGGTSASGQYPYYPDNNQGGGQGAGLNFGGGGGGGGGGGSAPGSFSAWLSSVLNQGYQNASALGNSGDLEASDAEALGGLDDAGLPLETVPGYGDIDQYLVTQDVPGSDDGDYGPQTIEDDTGDQINNDGGDGPGY